MFIASDKRRSAIQFLLYVLILLSVEKEFFTEAVVMGTVSTSWSNFVAESVLIKSFWCKKLRSFIFIANHLSAIESNKISFRFYTVEESSIIFDRLCNSVSSNS